jgi:lipopolysaccharide export system protein LptA
MGEKRRGAEVKIEVRGSRERRRVSRRRGMAARFACILIGGVALAGAPATLAAQDKGAAAGTAQNDTVTFTAKRMESVLAKGKEKTVLIGSANVVTGTMTITADRIELSGTDYDSVVCSGNVEVKDDSKGFDLKSASFEYDRKTEIGIAQTGVVLNDTKNNVLLKAEWARFDQKQSIVDARIGVHILKEDFAVRAEYASFNRNDESLKLSGMPVAVNADGTISAESMTGKADAQSLAMTGDISGTITIKPKEETKP